MRFRKYSAVSLFIRTIGLGLLLCGLCAAQRGGGQQAGGAGQAQTGQQAGGGGGGQAQTVPLQVHALEDWPTSLEAAEANLDRRFLQKKQVRVVWYRTKTSESSELPVILVPLTCGYVLAPGAGFTADQWFVDQCTSAANNDAAKIARRKDPEEDWRSLTPSLPTQNNHPLVSGHGLILAVYDKDDLLYKLHTSLLGVAITSQTAGALTPAPLRPTIAASGGGGGGSGGAGGSPGTIGAAIANAKSLLPSAGARVPDDACSGETTLTAIGGDDQRALSGHPFAPRLSVQALTGDGKAAGRKTIYFNVTEGDALARLDGVSAPTNSDGVAEIGLRSTGDAGKIEVVASCAGTSSTAMFHLGVRPNPYYYLPWSNNPVVGDTTLAAAVTAQAPTPTAVTVTTDPPGLAVKVGVRVIHTSTTVTLPTGAAVAVSADECQPLGMSKYKFLGWSDGGDRVHSVAIGSSAFTLKAGFVLEPSCPDTSSTASRPSGLLVPVTVVTNPPGLSAGVQDPKCVPQINGISCPAGSQINVATTASQTSGGIQYSFLNWSDGLANPHDVAVGPEPVKLVANFTTGFPYMGVEAVTVTTSQPGLAVSINNTTFVTPVQLYFAPNTAVRIQTPPQQLNGTQLYACTWRGNPNSLDYTVPDHADTVAGICSHTAWTAPRSGLTVATSPAGLAVIADSVEYAPKTNQIVPVPNSGARTGLVALDVPLAQSQLGKLYVFSNWSDNGLPQHDVNASVTPSVTATFTAAPAPSLPIPITVATDPIGLTFTVDGIKQKAPVVVYYGSGSQIALNAPGPQNLGGVQYTFQGWSDGGTTASHAFSVSAGQGGGQGGGQQNASPTPPASPLTVVGTFTASPPTEQSASLLNASYPQTHAVSYFNISTGLVRSNLRNSSWTRQETAPAVTCSAQSPQPCLPSPELYQTVPNPAGSQPLFPVLFFSVYLPGLPFDAERRWRPHDLIPAPSVGFSLSSPTTDFFFGGSIEVIRGVQLVGGAHMGQLNQLAPGGINDPTSSAAPATIQKFRWGGFYGVTFNISFIQSLFGGGKGGG
jgi:hypothetical protein